MDVRPPDPLPLIHYTPPTSREVVLQHGSSIVVFDPQSRQVSLAEIDTGSGRLQLETEDDACPTCGHLFNSNDGFQSRPDSQSGPSSPRTRAGAGRQERPDPPEQFMNSHYFRLLNYRIPSSEPEPAPAGRGLPFSSIGATGSARSAAGARPAVGLGIATGGPAGPSGSANQGISSAAFSQNYFAAFFVEEAVLGKGGNGVVLLVRHVLDGVSLGHFACKRVPVGDNHAWLKRVLGEVQLLQSVSHKNLVSYRHVWLEDCQLSKFSPTVPCAFILQQYCNGGDLLHYVLKPTSPSAGASQPSTASPDQSGTGTGLDFSLIFSFFKDITAGLHHLHSHGYLHRDLKPSNCLLQMDGPRIRALVSDFGEVQQISAARQSSGATGTLSYCAPEVLRPTADGLFANFSVKSDIFALGMIVYFMCFAQSPFENADDLHDENEDMEALRAEICAWPGFDEDEREKRTVRPDLPDSLYRFLKRLLSLDPAVRPDTAEILLGISVQKSAAQHPSVPVPDSRPSRASRPVRTAITAADSSSSRSRLQHHLRSESESSESRPPTRTRTDNLSSTLFPREPSGQTGGSDVGSTGPPPSRSTRPGQQVPMRRRYSVGTGYDIDPPRHRARSKTRPRFHNPNTIGHGRSSITTEISIVTDEAKLTTNDESNTALTPLHYHPLPPPDEDDYEDKDDDAITFAPNSVDRWALSPVQPRHQVDPTEYGIVEPRRPGLATSHIVAINTIRSIFFLARYRWLITQCEGRIPIPVLAIALVDFIIPPNLHISWPRIEFSRWFHSHQSSPPSDPVDSKALACTSPTPRQVSPPPSADSTTQPGRVTERQSRDIQPSPFIHPLSIAFATSVLLSAVLWAFVSIVNPTIRTRSLLSL